MMKSTVVALGAAAALAAGTVTAPKKAEAVPVWVAPAIAGAVVGGVALGAGAAHAHSYAYYDARDDAYAPEPAYAPTYSYAPGPVYESYAYEPRTVIIRRPAPRYYQPRVFQPLW